MKNRTGGDLFALRAPVLLAMSVWAGAGLAFSQAPLKTEVEWSVEGQWVDTCNCDIPCPCWQATPGKQTHMFCGDMLFFHVTKGHYGAAKLDGINIVQMAVSASGKPMMQSAEDQDFPVNTIYLAAGLPLEVAAAAEKIFGRITFLQPSTSKNHAVRQVSMEVALKDDTLSIKIPKILDAQIVRVKDAKGKSVPFPYDIQGVPYLGPGSQGKSAHYEYHDGGQSWVNSNTNGVWASFSFSSKQLPLPWDPDYKPPVAKQG